MKKTKKEIKEEEKRQFNRLYQYIKKEVYHYDDFQSLPSQIVLGIKGLKHGKAVENNHIENKADYPYDVILASFMLNKNKIDYAMKSKDFKSEIQAFVYIRKIVEGDLNRIYIKYKKHQKDKEEQNKPKVDVSMDIDKRYELAHENEDKKENHALDDLW